MVAVNVNPERVLCVAGGLREIELHRAFAGNPQESRTANQHRGPEVCLRVHASQHNHRLLLNKIESAFENRVGNGAAIAFTIFDLPRVLLRQQLALMKGTFDSHIFLPP